MSPLGYKDREEKACIMEAEVRNYRETCKDLWTEDGSCRLLAPKRRYSGDCSRALGLDHRKLTASTV